jgi:hypothetical protein
VPLARAYLLVPLLPVLDEPVPLPLRPLDPEAPGGQFIAELLLPLVPLEALLPGGQLAEELGLELPLVPRLDPELPVLELPEPSELDEPLLLSLFWRVELLPPELPVPMLLEPPVVPELPLPLVWASAAVPSDKARTETAVKRRRFIGFLLGVARDVPWDAFLLTATRRARSSKSSWSRSRAATRSPRATHGFVKKRAATTRPSSGRKSPKDLRRATGNSRPRTAASL